MSNTIEAIKEIYPNIEGGFVYWATKKDGTSWENPIDGLVWENTQYTKPTVDQLSTALSVVEIQKAKEIKIAESKSIRNSEFNKPLIARSGAPSYYLKPQPKVNIFLAGASMDALDAQSNTNTKPWEVCDINGGAIDGKLLVAFTKAELVSLSNHYEDRKTENYNYHKLRVKEINALTTVALVESYDEAKVFIVADHL